MIPGVPRHSGLLLTADALRTRHFFFLTFSLLNKVPYQVKCADAKHNFRFLGRQSTRRRGGRGATIFIVAVAVSSYRDGRKVEHVRVQQQFKNQTFLDLWGHFLCESDFIPFDFGIFSFMFVFDR